MTHIQSRENIIQRVLGGYGDCFYIEFNYVCRTSLFSLMCMFSHREIEWQCYTGNILYSTSKQ